MGRSNKYGWFNHKGGMSFMGGVNDKGVWCPGLISVAMFVKAMMFYESEMGVTDGYREPDKNFDAGLMQVDIRGGDEWWPSSFENSLNFAKGTDNMDAFNNSFNYIGIGVGHLFYKLSMVADYPFYGKRYRQAPTWVQWKTAIELYNGSSEYAEKVWELARNGNIIEKNPDGTPRKYKERTKIW